MTRTSLLLVFSGLFVGLVAATHLTLPQGERKPSTDVAAAVHRLDGELLEDLVRRIGAGTRC